MNRVQRKRTKGFKLPENTVCVNRGTKWGNPYKVGKPIQEAIGFNTMIINGVANKQQWLNNEPLNNHQACILYEVYLRDMIKHDPEKFDLSELKGKNLACFCGLDIECHADILINLINEKL